MTRQIRADIRAVLERSPARLVPGSYWYSQLPSGAAVPSGKFAIVDDGIEATVIAQRELSDNNRGPFALIRLEVAVPFESPGFLASVAAALASAELSVLILSTFTFDYLMIRLDHRDKALELLSELGMPVQR